MKSQLSQCLCPPLNIIVCNKQFLGPISFLFGGIYYIKYKYTFLQLVNIIWAGEFHKTLQMDSSIIKRYFLEGTLCEQSFIKAIFQFYPGLTRVYFKYSRRCGNPGLCSLRICTSIYNQILNSKIFQNFSLIFPCKVYIT